MQKIPRSKTNKVTKKIMTTVTKSILFSFAITVLLISAITFGNTGQQYTIGNAHAQTSPYTMSTATPANNDTNATTSTATTSAGENGTTTTTTNMTAGAVKTVTPTTIGNLIYKENGHRVISRIIEVTDNSYTTETTYIGNGVFNGTTSVTDMITTTATTNSTGQYSGKALGLLRTSDGTSMASYIQKYTGSTDLQGNDNAQGTIHFTALATGKLANLNNTNAIFKVHLDPAGSYTLQAWEQK